MKYVGKQIIIHRRANDTLDLLKGKQKTQKPKIRFQERQDDVVKECTHAGKG